MAASRSTVARLALALAISAALCASAQDSPNRKELKRTDLSGAPGMEVVLSVTEYKPGDTVSFHMHHGVETGYVLEGGKIDTNGKAGELLTGAPILNLRDVPHGGWKNSGTTTIKLVTVHIVDKGKPLYEPAKK